MHRRLMMANEDNSIIYDTIETKSGGNITVENKSISFANIDTRNFNPQIGERYEFSGYVDLEVTDVSEIEMVRSHLLTSSIFGYISLTTHFNRQVIVSVDKTIYRYAINGRKIITVTSIPAYSYYLFYMRMDYCIGVATSHVKIRKIS